jgi:hypothetical protein
VRDGISPFEDGWNPLSYNTDHAEVAPGSVLFYLEHRSSAVACMNRRVDDDGLLRFIFPRDDAHAQQRTIVIDLPNLRQADRRRVAEQHDLI